MYIMEMNDKESLNCILKEIDEYQSQLFVYKEWQKSCHNEDVGIVLKKLISSIEIQVEILYNEFNKKFHEGSNP